MPALCNRTVMMTPTRGTTPLHVVETVLENDTDGQMTCVTLACLSHARCRTDRTPRRLFRGEDPDLRVGVLPTT